MDDQAYLNSISSQVRPQKKSAGGLLSSPLAKVAIGGVALIIVVIIFSSMFSGGGGGIKEESISFKFHLDYTSGVINGYQSSVKSSRLRSSSASLASILSNTSRNLTNYLVGKYGFKDGAKEYKKYEEQAQLHQDELLSSLFDAKISGMLDRIYAHEMAHEIELIMAEETAIYDKISDEALKASLQSSYNSLDNLYPDFADFSESK
ncbi:hypothetical protein IKT18_00750 [Candidatus Saccharibacteria bacterium]|nr:hypothetical protein [Candidatus Saccharibacteria bacterium]